MEKKMMVISTSSFLKALLVLVLVGLVFLIWDILLLFFIALLLAALIMPLADWAEKKKIPRGLSVFLVYVVAIGIFVGVVALLVPPIIEQVSQLVGNYDVYAGKAMDLLAWFKNLGLHYGFWEPLSKMIPGTLQTGVLTAQKFVGSIFGVFEGLASFILILVMTFYIVAEEENFKKLVRYFTPVEYRPYFGVLWSKTKEKLSFWLRGQLFLDLIVGAMSYIGLLIIGAPYALLLGVLSGLFETVPYAGPIFSAVASVVLIVLQTGDWFMGLLALLVFIVIQQVENNFLVPKVMKKAVGIDPIVSILSLLIGYRLLGVTGAVIAIPLMAVVSVVCVEVFNWRAKKESK
ncbi:MAG: AI-2E family transporter [Candidatus Magasanikbacteria bacterium]|nr:AI-2E family transporter [Candidatus Magasanikbacteria bacterium]